MGLFIMKKGEIQVIISMIMFTRSSERIFNPSRYNVIIMVFWGVTFYTISDSVKYLTPWIHDFLKDNKFFRVRFLAQNLG